MIAALESEQALLGIAMSFPNDCAEAFERVRPDHFAEHIHGAMWEILRTGAVFDPVLLAEKIGHHPAFKEMGGLSYLGDLVDHAYLPTLSGHVDSVLDASTRRALHGLSMHVASAANDPGHGEALLAEIERGAADIARDGASRPVGAPAGLTALENLEASWRGEFAGVPVGLECMDHVTGGIRQDDVWFIGGRTSMGKSVVALGLGKGLAQQGRGVMMFSLEMPMREVQARLIADLAHDFRGYEPVRYGDLLKGRGGQMEKDKARAAAARLASMPIIVNDMGGLTIEDIRTQSQRQLRAWEKMGIRPGAILIDHIGLVRPVRKTDSKASDTADTVNELKGMAKQLRCPIIALVQVNRATEGRNDKRPTLSDLNWSGAIEQIADMICLLYREGYYLTRSASREDQDRAPMVEHEIELLIHKNRAGPICTVNAWIDVTCNAIRDPREVGRAYG